ncbi:Zinc finger, CCHC-type, partial [Parasponia andersonii]
MRAILAQLDLDDALLGINTMPSSLSMEEKQRRDRKALSQIQLHLSNQILQYILNEKIAATLWLKLEQLCMMKSLTNKLHQKQRLYSHRIAEGTSLEEHINVFKEIVSDLEALEVKYESEDLALILLCSLPPSDTPFRDTILYSRESLTLSVAYDSLISKEKMDQIVTGTETQAEGLVARGRTQERNFGSDNRGRSKSRNKSKTCNYCKKKGHIKSECYKFQNKNKKATPNHKGKQTENTGEASVAEDDISDGKLLIVSD